MAPVLWIECPASHGSNGVETVKCPQCTIASRKSHALALYLFIHHWDCEGSQWQPCECSDQWHFWLLRLCACVCVCICAVKGQMAHDKWCIAFTLTSLKLVVYRSCLPTAANCTMYQRIILTALENTSVQWLFCWLQKHAMCMASPRHLGWWPTYCMSHVCCE